MPLFGLSLKSQSWTHLWERGIGLQLRGINWNEDQVSMSVIKCEPWSLKMGLLERRREYVREKQRGSREEVLIEERTQKEKEEREQRKGVCVCVCLHTHARVWYECVCVGGWHKGRERWKQIGERELRENREYRYLYVWVYRCVCVCKRMTKREVGGREKKVDTWKAFPYVEATVNQTIMKFCKDLNAW